ncbi:GyrI-like domain-containing protein [Streptomyces sp. NPDC059909]|uniref:GyrI-like domain-containing protein n=1 Tax=Streptomyces sp. NPDC059909 TaxID=3346998 RepID=UPI003651DF13
MLERLNQAMEYIERHLDEQIDVSVLARIAVTSEYHMRRIFSALAGMPLSEYIRRRRLTLAGAEVLAGERTLLDIAVRHGYGSGEAFARAFRAMHGVGPAEARRTGAALHSQPRMSFRLIVEGSSSMRYRIVQKDEFRVVGRKARVPLVHEGMNPEIVSFVRGIGRETLERMEALSDQEPRGIVAVSDNLADSRAEGTELDYYHGVVTGAEAPDDMAELTVPAGAWAVFEHSGPFPETLQYLWRDVFTQWFPSNPFRSRPGPEILRTRLSPDATEADAELWIPVERTTAGPATPR